MLDLNKEARRCLVISKKRQEHGGVGDDVLKHCAGEVAEAIEARGYYETLKQYEAVAIAEKTTVHEAAAAYAAELADGIICNLVAAAEAGLDIEAALSKKIKQNEARAEGRGDKK